MLLAKFGEAGRKAKSVVRATSKREEVFLFGVVKLQILVDCAGGLVD